MRIMTKTRLLPTQTLTALGFAALLSACSGSSEAESETPIFSALGVGNPMTIVSCSLGCSPGAPGSPIDCAIGDIGPNTELVIEFSKRVDLTSVSSASFQIINQVNGSSPAGSFFLDPQAPTKLIFRPELSFDAKGTPQFGFDSDSRYRLHVLGTDLVAGNFYVQSTDGLPNATDLDCVIVTSQAPMDFMLGPPTVTAFVTDVLDAGSGQVSFDPVTNDPIGGVTLDGASGLAQAARIVLVFDDFMNETTVLDRLTGQSSGLGVFIDLDGNLSTVDDVVIQPGQWDLQIDQDVLLRSVAIFTPEGGFFPLGGTDTQSPRRVLLTLDASLTDLVGLPITNPGMSSFALAPSGPIEQVVLEDFTLTEAEDAAASGATWGNGLLAPGRGGGSGRLGELHLRDGETVVLNTDSQDFPLTQQHNSLLTNVDPGPGVDQYDPLDSNAWPMASVDQLGDGFEFSRLTLDAGSRLVLTGSRPGRVFVRGELLNEGVIDLSGDTPPPHVSNTGGNQINNEQDPQDSASGGLGGLGGPGAGRGGQGADRMDMTDAVLPLMVNIGGTLNPGAELDGRPGAGVGGLDNGTGGLGGVHYPPTLPAFNNPSNALYGDTQLSSMESVGDGNCRVGMVAGSGSGGAHALDGGRGLSLSPFISTALINPISTSAPVTAGGDNQSLGLEAPGSPPSPNNQRNLEFWRRHLRGGAGGGGGGTSIYASRDNQASSADSCTPVGSLFPFWDHSAAGGGGGGGALMMAAGRRFTNTGVIDGRGGDGGSSTQPGAPPTLCTQSGAIGGQAPNCGMMAAPGGGGAGGAVRIQSPIIELGVEAGRIDVSGGQGGMGAGNSFGGLGSPGLVRLEYPSFLDQAADAAQFAESIAPYLPDDPAFNTPFTSAAILSIGEWGVQSFRPESYSGSQSCWMAPEVAGGFFELEFVADTPGAPDDLSRLGWNMDIVYAVPGVGRRLFPYRGLPPSDPNDAYDESLFPSAALGGADFATYFGSMLNQGLDLDQGSFLTVRFQGVKGANLEVDPCQLDLASTDVEEDSLTPFVSHPALLNDFELGTNLFRFAVVFDKQLANFDPVVAGRVLGVTNLRVRVIAN